MPCKYVTEFVGKNENALFRGDQRNQPLFKFRAILHDSPYWPYASGIMNIPKELLVALSTADLGKTFTEQTIAQHEVEVEAEVDSDYNSTRRHLDSRCIHITQRELPDRNFPKNLGGARVETRYDFLR